MAFFWLKGKTAVGIQKKGRLALRNRLGRMCCLGGGRVERKQSPGSFNILSNVDTVGDGTFNKG